MSDLLEYELRPLGLPECELVAAWAASPEEGQVLGVGDEFPLTADTVAAWTYEVDYALPCGGRAIWRLTGKSPRTRWSRMWRFPAFSWPRICAGAA